MNHVRYAVWILAFGAAVAGCAGDMESEPVGTTNDELLRARICGGPRDRGCGEGQYCDGLFGSCPERWFGICRPEPEVCTDIFAPVCGCDGQTYSNRCYAHAAGVAVDHRGECAAAGCESNEDCAADQYCNQHEACGGAGACEVRPEACTKIYEPVCGCDGVTYGNACVAAASGVSVARNGECASAPRCGGFPGTPCPGAGSCVDDPSDDCDPDNGGADCGGLCECNSIGLCVDGQHWDSSPEVCGCVPDANPCSVVLCPSETECVVVDGEPVCEPREGESCGATTCGPGLECCNASCGICVPPGRVCIQIACD